MHANWKAFTVAFIAGAAIGLTAWFTAPRKSLPVPVVPVGHSGDAAAALSNSIQAQTSGIHFRIVDVDGASVANAHVVLRMEGRNGTFSSIVRGSADATGAFSAEANFLPGCRALTATVGLPDGGASRIHRLTRPEELTGAWEAGDLAMQPLKLIDIVVRDRSGAPISGAAVQTTEKERQPLFTHVGGRAELRAAAGDFWLDVSAAGFVATKVAIPKEWESGKERHELVVELDQLCRLTLRLSPAPPEGCRVDVSMSFTRKERPQDFFPEEKPRKQILESGASESGVCEWRDFPAATPLHLDVSSLGAKLGSLDIKPLEVGEHRFEDFHVDVQAESVNVQVSGPDGEPVKIAGIMLTPDIGERMMHQRQWTADTSGMVSMNLYLPAVLDVCVEAEGYATKVTRRVDMSTRKFLVQLERERIVEVEILDTEGKPSTERMNLVCAYASDHNVSICGKEAGPGHWRINNLPTGEVLIEASGGSNRGGSILHNTSIPTAKLVIGHPGRLDVSFEVDELISSDSWAVRATSLMDPKFATRAFAEVHRRPPMHAYFLGLPTGHYQIQVEHMDPNGSGEWQPRGSPVTAKVGDDAHEIAISLGK